MADIQELCERVIVIHKGEKIYDGALDLLEARSGARHKIVKFLPQPGAFPENWTSRHGQAVRDEEGRVTLSVPATDIVAVSQEILTAGSVADITIEDVPLEDVIADLFTSR
jgi:ABC-2 type transport system ATP-binding protein